MCFRTRSWHSLFSNFCNSTAKLSEIRLTHGLCLRRSKVNRYEVRERATPKTFWTLRSTGLRFTATTGNVGRIRCSSGCSRRPSTGLEAAGSYVERPKCNRLHSPTIPLGFRWQRRRVAIRPYVHDCAAIVRCPCTGIARVLASFATPRCSPFDPTAPCNRGTAAARDRPAERTGRAGLAPVTAVVVEHGRRLLKWLIDP